MKQYVGHDEHEDRDYLLTIFEDGTHMLATRPGRLDTATRWRRAITLAPDLPREVGAVDGAVAS